MFESDQPVPLGDAKPVVGTFICINLAWTSHDFSRSRFLISDESQLRRVLALGTENLSWIPAKSRCHPVKVSAEPAPPEPAAPQPTPPTPPTLPAPDRERLERDRLARAERQWAKSAVQVREAFLMLRDNPKQGGVLVRGLTEDIAKSVGESDKLLYLITQSSEIEQHHGLNCMMLSVFLATKLQLPEQAIAQVAQAALAHDVGKTMIPQWVVQTASRKKPEEMLYREHCRRGVEALRLSEAFSEAVIAAVEDHHERLDGSGYPAGKKGEQIGLVARIIAVVDTYDELRAPESPQVEPLSADEAMRRLWRDQESKLDARIVTAFVKMLGVYPPGTFVGLSDGSCGLVVAPGNDSLRPRVMIYERERTAEEASIVDLDERPDLSVAGVVDPEHLSPELLRVFNPRALAAYSFAASAKQKD